MFNPNPERGNAERFTPAERAELERLYRQAEDLRNVVSNLYAQAEVIEWRRNPIRPFIEAGGKLTMISAGWDYGAELPTFALDGDLVPYDDPRWEDCSFAQGSSLFEDTELYASSGERIILFELKPRFRPSASAFDKGGE